MSVQISFMINRKLFRVPMNFDWPMNVVWPGFLFYHNEKGDCRWDTERGEYDCDKSWHNEIPPPEGPGCQMWETTSEGSPISPIFETLDALCEWAAVNSSTFAGERASAEEWREVLLGERNLT